MGQLSISNDQLAVNLLGAEVASARGYNTSGTTYVASPHAPTADDYAEGARRSGVSGSAAAPVSASHVDEKEYIEPDLSEIYDRLDSIRSEVNSMPFDIDSLYDLVDYNHAYDKQTQDFNANQAEISRAFNSAEAEKSRKWEEEMSNTAHQREVQDLIKAGLNPVLSAKLGGASTPSSAFASSSPASGQNTSSGVISSLFGAIINSATNMAMKMVDRQNTIDRIQADLRIAQGYNEASRFGSELSANAQLAVSQGQIESNQLINQRNIESQEAIAREQHEVDLYKSELQAYKDIVIEQYYPKTQWSAAASVGNRLIGTLAEAPIDDLGAAKEYFKTLLLNTYSPVNSSVQGGKSNVVTESQVKAAIRSLGYGDYINYVYDGYKDLVGQQMSYNQLLSKMKESIHLYGKG